MTPHDAFSLLSTLHARESVHIEKRVTIRHASLLSSSHCALERTSVPLDLDERASRRGVSFALSVVRRCTPLFVAVRCDLRRRGEGGTSISTSCRARTAGSEILLVHKMGLSSESDGMD